MKKVITYEVLVLLFLTVITCECLAGGLPKWGQDHRLWILCIIMGGAGGCVYCLRGVYLSACVRKDWNEDWYPWYCIRPIVSMICGGVSCLFLKAGLLVLESSQQDKATDLGFLALAFVAGMNVDKFIAKIEDIAQAAWGIEKSRSSKEESRKESTNKTATANTTEDK